MDYEGKFEKARIEVLETKIKVDSKNHENEKEKIIKEKDQEIRSLEAKNESLLNELDMKGEKMRQLDFSNKNKDSQIQKNYHYTEELKKEYEVLKKRADNLEIEISLLEEKRSKLTEIVQRNEENKISMETEIHSLKRELDLVRAAKLEQEIIIAQIQREARDCDQKWEERMNRQEEDQKRNERLRDEKWDDRTKKEEQKAVEREEEKDKKWAERMKRQDEKTMEMLKENDQKWEQRMIMENEIWEKRMERLREEANNEKIEHKKAFEKIDRKLGELTKSTTKVKNDKETVMLPRRNKDKFVIHDSQNMQFRSGNHFYIRQSPRRQVLNISRGKIKPPIQLKFPKNLRSSQNRRGNCLGSKSPSYNK